MTLAFFQKWLVAVWRETRRETTQQPIFSACSELTTAIFHLLSETDLLLDLASVSRTNDRDKSGLSDELKLSHHHVDDSEAYSLVSTLCSFIDCSIILQACRSREFSLCASNEGKFDDFCPHKDNTNLSQMETSTDGHGENT